jgi:hypothetical protein
MQHGNVNVKLAKACLCRLFYNVLSNGELCMESNSGMTDEGWITQNLEGVRYSPIEVLFQNFNGGNEENGKKKISVLVTDDPV